MIVTFLADRPAAGDDGVTDVEKASREHAESEHLPSPPATLPLHPRG